MLRVDGPAAERFVALMRRLSGLDLELANSTVAERAGAAPPAGGAATLLAAIRGAIDGPQVTVHAFANAPAAGLIDTFLGHDDPDQVAVRQRGLIHFRPRSVFVGQLEAIEAIRSEVAAGLLGHILVEYTAAAGPNGVGFDPAHARGFLAEARIVNELTGRPLSPQPTDNPIQVLPGGAGALLRRHYGPGNVYTIRFGPQPLNAVQAVTRSNLQ